MGRNLFRVLLVLWAGSLWSLAVWVAPTLFDLLADRHQAGALAARLFSIEAYLGMAVAAAALILARTGGMGAPRMAVAGTAVARSGAPRMGGLYVAAALLAVSEFVLKRFMEAARIDGATGGLSFGAWHGISAILYIAACLAVLVVIWKEDFR
jgi:hypothetical protein